MKTKIKDILYRLSALMSLIFIMASCNNDDNPESPYVDNKTETTILIYAVASNNLESNLTSDKNEILSCASQLDLDRNKLLVYEIKNSYEPVLLELVKGGDGNYSYKTIKEYDTDLSSLDARRMKEVFNDMRDNYKSEKYGLILWSHGTGLDYYPETKTRSEEIEAVSLPMAYSFGYDKNPETGTVTQMNIDVLANAIPDNLFSFIWFDACYMSGIETIYELRDKCDVFVGYPTEVFEWGMAYNLVIPHILKTTPDLVEGARAFFNYYAENANQYARVATVAVIDMDKLPALAEISSEIYALDSEVDIRKIQKYTRNTVGPFYDLNGYMLQKIKNAGDDSLENEWRKALDDLIIYKASTTVDFNYNSIDLDQFSGISCHIYNPDSNSDYENYYRQLDWFKNVVSVTE